MSEEEVYPLHKAAFFNDVHAIARLLKEGWDVSAQDLHGNTALHISTMLGHREATALLLAHNAPVKVKNCDGWNPMMEAVSYGDRQIIAQMVRKLKVQASENIAKRKPHLLKVLRSVGDFYLELKWDFHTWVPILSKMLPNDLCRIHKRGAQIRVDTTLADFQERSWERGDISFIFNAEARDEDQLMVIDNQAKMFRHVRFEESDDQVDEKVDLLMASDIVTAQMSTKPITFTPAYSGWVFRHEREEQIGDYAATFHEVEGMNLVTRKRREHLTESDVKKNKSFIQNFAQGATAGKEEYVKSLQPRQSLPPPCAMPITWEEYKGAGAVPQLGRPHTVKKNSKQFKALIGMADDFPLDIQVLLDILELVAPIKHLKKLRQFCEAKLPPGFPVKLEIPIFPTISAKVTFQRFKFVEILNEDMFRVPASYIEDRSPPGKSIRTFSKQNNNTEPQKAGW